MSRIAQETTRRVVGLISQRSAKIKGKQFLLRRRSNQARLDTTKRMRICLCNLCSLNQPKWLHGAETKSKTTRTSKLRTLRPNLWYCRQQNHSKNSGARLLDPMVRSKSSSKPLKMCKNSNCSARLPEGVPVLRKGFSGRDRPPRIHQVTASICSQSQSSKLHLKLRRKLAWRCSNAAKGKRGLKIL